MSKNKKCKQGKTQKVIQEVKINVSDFVRPPDPPVITYERITIPLPQPPGVVNLPPAIFFEVDNRFTAAEKQIIRSVIGSFLFSWNAHYVQTATDGQSDLAACSEMYAELNLAPVWASLELKQQIGTSGEIALEVAMDAITQAFRDNGNMTAPTARIEYSTKRGTILGLDGSSQFNIALTVTVNPNALDTTLTNLSGSLFHAWMHRVGYRHPGPVYTTYLIGEAPMCLMRNNQMKVPGQPDSVYTQYFD